MEMRSAWGGQERRGGRTVEEDVGGMKWCWGWPEVAWLRAIVVMWL